MPAVFGSGATVDGAGVVVPPSAGDVGPVLPVEAVAPAEQGGGLGAAPEQPTLPGEGPTEPVSPSEPVADQPPEEPPSADEPSDEEVPREVRSERHFRRQLIDDNKFYREQLTRQQQAQMHQAQQLAALVQQLATLTQAPASPSAAPGVPDGAPAGPAGQPQPRPDGYATHEEYVTALTSWAATEAVQRAEAAREQRELAQRQQWEAQRRQEQEWQREQAWHAKLAAGRQQFENFDVVTGNPAVRVAEHVKPIVVQSVLESPHGEAMLHYLGVYPDVTQALNQMSPYAAARLLGEIEAVVRPRAVEPPPTPPARPQAPPVVPVTPAPTPLQPVGASQAPPGAGQFRQGMSLDAYTRMREAQMQKR